MKPSRASAYLGLAAFLCACQSTPAHDPDHDLHNKWAGVELRQASLRRAILGQRALYAYHFEIDSAELNELGERDLDLLAEHYLTNPGELRMARSGASSDLYSRRVATVLDELAALGVEIDRMNVVDGMALGGGAWSERVLTAASRRGLSDESSSSSVGIDLGQTSEGRMQR